MVIRNVRGDILAGHQDRTKPRSEGVSYIDLFQWFTHANHLSRKEYELKELKYSMLQIENKMIRRRSYFVFPHTCVGAGRLFSCSSFLARTAARIFRVVNTSVCMGIFILSWPLLVTLGNLFIYVNNRLADQEKNVSLLLKYDAISQDFEMKKNKWLSLQARESSASPFLANARIVANRIRIIGKYIPYMACETIKKTALLVAWIVGPLIICPILAPVLWLHKAYREPERKPSLDEKENEYVSQQLSEIQRVKI